MYSVLLVEDIEECQIVVKRAFANTSVQLSIAPSVQMAWELINARQKSGYDLVILDLGLPDGEGLSILEGLRSKTGDMTPVFLLTSESDLDSKVLAFNLGADDYLTKPISAVELRARVEMRLKKNADRANGQNIVTKGELSLDLTTMRASLNSAQGQNALNLTLKEFKILSLLVRNEGRVFSRQDLIKAVWSEYVHVQERTVDSHIFGLRKKLGSYADVVECIPGVGYRFLDPLIQGNIVDKSESLN